MNRQGLWGERRQATELEGPSYLQKKDRSIIKSQQKEEERRWKNAVIRQEREVKQSPLARRQRQMSRKSIEKGETILKHTRGKGVDPMLEACQTERRGRKKIAPG